MNTTILRLAAGTLAATTLLIPTFALAQTVTASSTAPQDFSAEIAYLQQELAQIRSIHTGSTLSTTTMMVPPSGTAASLPHICLSLPRSLSEGSKGSDVTQLQEMLTQYPSIYPQGSVTGYYGPATAAAVGKLQVQLGVTSTATAQGMVGVKTRAALKSGCGGIGTQMPSPGMPGTNASTTPISVITPMHPIIASTTLQNSNGIHFAAPTQAQGQTNPNVGSVTATSQPSSVSI